MQYASARQPSAKARFALLDVHAADLETLKDTYNLIHATKSMHIVLKKYDMEAVFTIVMLWDGINTQPKGTINLLEDFM